MFQLVIAPHRKKYYRIVIKNFMPTNQPIVCISGLRATAANHLGHINKIVTWKAKSFLEGRFHFSSGFHIASFKYVLMKSDYIMVCQMP